MDKNQAILIGLALVPVVLLTILRINAALVFLSICLGYVLMQFLGPDIKSFAIAFMSHASVSTNVMKLTLLLFPPVVTSAFMIHTIRGTRLVLNLLPAIGCGYLLAVLLVPLAPLNNAQLIMGGNVWKQGLRLEDLILGISALMSLLFLWMQRPHHGGEDSKKNH